MQTENLDVLASELEQCAIVCRSKCLTVNVNWSSYVF